MTSKQNEEVVLSRLVRLFRQSPLMYLSDSNVWTYRGDESLKLTLVDVVSDHQNFVDRAETILVAEQFELPQCFLSRETRPQKKSAESSQLEGQNHNNDSNLQDQSVLHKIRSAQ